MVAVREIDLIPLGVRLPNNRVGIVLLQPHVQLTDVEPFKVRVAAIPQQLGAISKTLQIALARDHGEDKTHFTVFPELSIPGLEGVALIDDAVHGAAWPTSTFVIGGVDGLRKNEYQALCSTPNTFVDAPRNAPASVQDAQWVNCSVTWVKGEDGAVHRWIQPKICPAWVEQNVAHQQMFHGGSVYLFRCRFANGAMCRFFSLICFDWVGSQGGNEIVPQVLESISGLAGGESISLHWIFVLQCNDSPNHPTFLNRIDQVLVQQGLAPAARRDDVCVVFCNVSGRGTPGHLDTFGRTSLVFSPRAPLSIKDSCRPSYSGKSRLTRGADTIATCKDTVLRENGACIHSLSQNVTAFMAQNAANRASSLEVVNVHAWSPAAVPDARTPGAQVPCCVKWANDELDVIRQLEHPEAASELAHELPAVHQTNIAALRIVPSAKLDESIQVATCAELSGYADADYWDETQAYALETVLDTIDVLRLAYGSIDIGTSSGHAAFSLEGQRIDVVGVRGEKHEVCAGHVRDRITPRMRHKLLIVSRDRDNTPLLAKHKRIFEVAKAAGEEAKITEPDDYVHLAFFEVLQSFRNTSTRADLEHALNGQLAV